MYKNNSPVAEEFIDPVRKLKPALKPTFRLALTPVRIYESGYWAYIIENRITTITNNS